MIQKHLLPSVTGTRPKVDLDSGPNDSFEMADEDNGSIPGVDVDMKDVIVGALGEVGRITNIDELEAEAYRIMDNLPESMSLLRQIDMAKGGGGTSLVERLVARQRAIYEDIVAELSLITGVETDEIRNKRENAEYRQRITDSFEDVDLENIDSGEILSRMGMLVTNDAGELVFNFPRDIFPPHLCEKWDHYIDIVSRHVGSEHERTKGVDNVREIATLDALRRQAHNNLSRAIKNFLLLDEWDLEKCRRLVIKMRDAQLPNAATAEQHTTAQEIARLVGIARQAMVGK